MKLPIRNRTDKSFTLFMEPYCDEYEVSPEAEAIIVLGDNPRHPHSIVVLDDQLSVWSEGGEQPSVEIILKEEQSIIESLRLARTWLHRLGAKGDSDVIECSINDLESENGYLEARIKVFEAFHSGFLAKDGEASPSSDALPAWSGPKFLAVSYRAGGIAAYRNYLDRGTTSFPGLGLGPLDTDTVRSAFANAAQAITAAKQG